MAVLTISSSDALFYDYREPVGEAGVTFVFFNALTGDTGLWEAVIGPALRKQGHGTLAFNFRGQTDSPFAEDALLDAKRIVADAITLLAHVNPVKPVLVGLSIGGLFAAQAWLEGTSAQGLVLINTLRRDGPRLKWIGDALVQAVDVGGLELFRDLYLPLLMNEDWLAENRENFLKAVDAYAPLDTKSGIYKLLAEAGRTADWDIPYEKLNLPVLVITGLQDHVFLDLEVVAKLTRRLPDARRVNFSDAGHLIPAERPEALTEALLDFVKEVD